MPVLHRPLVEMDSCWLGPPGVLDRCGEKEREVSEGAFPLASFPGRQAPERHGPGPGSPVRTELASSLAPLPQAGCPRCLPDFLLAHFLLPPLGPGREACVHTGPRDAPARLAQLGRRWGPGLLPEPRRQGGGHPQSLGPRSAPRLGCSRSVPHPECPRLPLGRTGVALWVPRSASDRAVRAGGAVLQALWHVGPASHRSPRSPGDELRLGVVRDWLGASGVRGRWGLEQHLCHCRPRAHSTALGGCTFLGACPGREGPAALGVWCRWVLVTVASMTAGGTVTKYLLCAGSSVAFHSG